MVMLYLNGMNSVLGGECGGRHQLEGNGNFTDGPGSYGAMMDCEWTIFGTWLFMS